jgi:thioredoxin-like negative regulator of GroEL
MGEDQSPYENLETQEEIENIMRDGGGTVVLDFWSETCGPCMAMAKDFEDVAGQFDPDEVRFCKVNTGTHGHLAAPFNVRSIPTILFIHNGKILDAVVGKMSAKALGEKSEWLLGKASRKPGLLSKIFG